MQNLPFPTSTIPNPRVHIPDTPAPSNPTTTQPNSGRNSRRFEDPINADAKKGNRQALRSMSLAEELAWSKHPPWEPTFTVIVNHIVHRLEEGDMSFLQYAQLFTLNRRLDRMFYKYQFSCVKHLWKLFDYVGPNLDGQLRNSIINVNTPPHPNPSHPLAHNLFRVMDFVKRLTVMEGDRGNPKHVLQMMSINCVTLDILEHYRPLRQKWFCPNLVSLRWLAYSNNFLQRLLDGHWIDENLRELHLAVGEQVSPACLREFIVALPTKFPHILNIKTLAVSGVLFDHEDVMDPFAQFVSQLKGLTEFHHFEARATSTMTMKVLQLPQLEIFSWCNQYTTTMHEEDTENVQLPAISALPLPGSVPQAAGPTPSTLRKRHDPFITAYGEPGYRPRPSPGSMFQSVRVLKLHAPYADIVYLLGELAANNNVRWLSIKTKLISATQIEVLTTLIAVRITPIRHLDLSFQREEDELYFALRSDRDDEQYEELKQTYTIRREQDLQEILQDVRDLPEGLRMEEPVWKMFDALANHDEFLRKTYFLLRCCDVIRHLESRNRNPRPRIPEKFLNPPSFFLWALLSNMAARRSQRALPLEPDYGPQILEGVSNGELLRRARLWPNEILTQIRVDPKDVPLSSSVKTGYDALNTWLSPYDTRPRLDAIDWRCFRPLYFCKALRHFSLDMEKVFDVKISDSDLEDMANAWSFEQGPVPPHAPMRLPEPARRGGGTEIQNHALQSHSKSEERGIPDTTTAAAASSMSDSTSVPSNEAAAKPTNQKEPNGARHNTDASAAESDEQKELEFYPSLPGSDINAIFLRINERDPEDYYVAELEPAVAPEEDEATTDGSEDANTTDDVSEAEAPETGAAEAAHAAVSDTNEPPRSGWSGSGLRYRPHYEEGPPPEYIDRRFLPKCTLRGIATLTGRLRDSLHDVYIPFNAIDAKDFRQGRWNRDDKECKPSIHLERFHISSASRVPIIAELGSNISKWMEETWPVAELIIAPNRNHQIDQPNWARINALKEYVSARRIVKAKESILQAHETATRFEAQVQKRQRQRDEVERLDRERDANPAATTGITEGARAASNSISENEQDASRRQTSPNNQGRVPSFGAQMEQGSIKRSREYDEDFENDEHVSKRLRGRTTDTSSTKRGLTPVRHATPHTTVSASPGPSGVETDDDSAGPVSPSSATTTPPTPTQRLLPIVDNKRKRNHHEDHAEGSARPQKVQKHTQS